MSSLRSVLTLALGVLCAMLGATAEIAPAFRAQVEADWLAQEELRYGPQSAEVTTQNDAAGACDGIKNGEWGFHTTSEANPWWQVDLGAVQPIARVALWNRCDGVAARNNNIEVLLSDDGTAWRTVYRHDGTTFYGFTDGRPLVVPLDGAPGRFVRLQIPRTDFLHLDEVEVFGVAEPEQNVALRRPADQSSISQWSADHRPPQPADWGKRVARVLAHSRGLVEDLRAAGLDVAAEAGALDRLATVLPDEAVYFEARWVQRALTLRNPLLDFEALLFTKRVPGSFNHMSDQYYGWWSRPGGGLYVLRGFREGAPEAQCLTDAFTEPGSFLRPSLSYDGSKVLFAWCRYYPDLAVQPDKLNKANVPEDAFYHVFEMNADGTGVRPLTHGKYDDFDARYLPDGRIVFLSTRRGQFLQCGKDTAARTVDAPDLPDVYVRCGGGPERPVAVYTLHTMDADGGDLCAISPFEMFEWTPSIAHDGTILYSRWDYVDRNNMPYMSLWSIRPDGTNARLVYGNFTHAPHCTFEPACIPDSAKLVFTGSAHHAQTMGSLVLLDPAVGTEGAEPITRLTPEVVFPEIEGWPSSSFANPWPLSERLYLTVWGRVDTVRQGQQMAPNGMGLYVLDAAGNLELLYGDPDISSWDPIPLRPRMRPPVVATVARRDAPKEGAFLVADVYRGLPRTARGDVKALRIVAVPAKTHPTMNYPAMGLTHDDPGKCVLGTVPVEADGSAYFRAPAGVMLFFQALDARGMAIQTMRGASHVQPGQTLSCIGCHEPRNQAPSAKPVLASGREPSRIAVGPEGSWPLRFDRLVQPVLDAQCVRCHRPEGEDPTFDLSPANAYAALCDYGHPSLREHILERYREGRSVEGACAAATSPLLALLTGAEPHYGVRLDADGLERLATWMDTYAQWLGSFCEEQERQLTELRRDSADLIVERETTVAGMPRKTADVNHESHELHE